MKNINQFLEGIINFVGKKMIEPLQDTLKLTRRDVRDHESRISELEKRLGK